jgi:tRNA-dihydrouridine synthase
MTESYKDQFTPHVDGITLLRGVFDNPQCKEDVDAIITTATIYDIYFSSDGIIYGAPKS